MPELPLLLNLPLKVRGIKGGYFHRFHNSPYPSYLKRSILEKFSEIQIPKCHNRFFAHSPCLCISIAVGPLGEYETLLDGGLLSPDKSGLAITKGGKLSLRAEHGNFQRLRCGLNPRVPGGQGTPLHISVVRPFRVVSHEAKASRYQFLRKELATTAMKSSFP